MVKFELKDLVFNYLRVINEETGLRGINIQQIYKYMEVLLNEFNNNNIKVTIDMDIINFQDECLDFIHIYNDGINGYDFFMLPWVEVDDLIIERSGPMPFEVFKIFYSRDIILQIMNINKEEKSRLEKLEMIIDEFHIKEVINLIDEYLDGIDKEQAKLDKYKKIKLRSRKNFC